ncbi:hypothetical protein AAFF_G00367370 [Aldrovandia affinis]|uniref:HTH psq-type domain-containing protein n=1 Tax=Aldrovandia affinis TaxID=143900 RepID=A0AAD7SHJ7_9TELE|nr:hypothetical protein AAFF_G00367370 [Aldrovandia affinis]
MRNPKRKTDRGVSREVLILAAGEVERGRSIRGAAKSYSICHVTLNRFISLSRKLKEAGSLETPTVGYKSPRQVFSKEQEKDLRLHLQTASAMYYGLSPREVRKLAFQCAVQFNCNQARPLRPESFAPHTRAALTAGLESGATSQQVCPGPPPPMRTT